jgi:hypothetical protein
VPEIVAALTARELRRLLAPFLGPPRRLLRIGARDWQAYADGLNTVRRHRVMALYAIAARNAKPIRAVQKAIAALKALGHEIAATSHDHPDDNPLVEPNTIDLAVWRAQIVRYRQVMQWSQWLENGLLPLLDPRRAMAGGHTLSAKARWEKAAHVAWFALAPIFTRLALPIGRRAPSRFLDALAAILDRLGFPTVLSLTLERWAERHKAILPPADGDP